MKFDIKSWGSREDWEFLLRRILRFFSRLSRAVLVTHIRATELVVTLVMLAVALALGIVLVYLPPSQAEVIEPKTLELNTKVIDFLTTWRQERDQERSGGLTIPADALFP